MNEKVMIFDGAMADALAKMGDSLNISLNALEHNFENQEFWQGFHAAFMQAHFDYVWGLASVVDKVMLDKFVAEAAKAVESPGGAATAANAATPVPGAPAAKPDGKK